MSELAERLRNTATGADDLFSNAPNELLRASADAIDAHEARIEELEKENERLAGAWRSLHERMVKDNESHARYFEKSQARA